MLLKDRLDILYGVNTSKNKTSPYTKDLSGSSIARRLKGKGGRFRANLRGIRVDYSARSVVSMGHNLTLYQCGLPYEIARVLYRHFIIRHLSGKKKNGYKIHTRVQSRQFIDQEKEARLHDMSQIRSQYPICVNRAPTLHKFNFQSFCPHLVSGRTIQFHPLVCSLYNADFDGDQVGVHVPIFSKTLYESWRLLSPASVYFSGGFAKPKPNFHPSHEIVLGIYFMTTHYPRFQICRNKRFTVGSMNHFEIDQHFIQ